MNTSDSKRSLKENDNPSYRTHQHIFHVWNSCKGIKSFIRGFLNPKVPYIRYRTKGLNIGDMIDFFEVLKGYPEFAIDMEHEGAGNYVFTIRLARGLTLHSDQINEYMRCV